MVSPFAALARFLAERLRPIGACGHAGLIVGMIVGGLLGIHDLVEGGIDIATSDLLAYWLLLSLFGWVVLLAIFTLFVRWTLSSVIVPTAINTLLVTGLTLLIVVAAHLYVIAFFVGLLVGLIVGALLCQIGRWLKGARDGLY
jgi:hypothetical protein